MLAIIFGFAQEKQQVQVTLTDMTGKTVMESNLLLAPGNNQKEISINQLNKGVYTLRIKGANQLFTQKIIKQ